MEKYADLGLEGSRMPGLVEEDVENAINFLRLRLGDQADNLYEEMDDEEDEVVISDPMKMSEVSFQLPGGIRIKQLSKDLKEFIFTNLDIPSSVSVGTWQSVSEFLSANDTFPMQQTISAHDPWKPYENMHAQVLVNALYKTERIDLLWKIKEKVDENDYVEPISNEPTPPSSAVIPSPAVVAQATIEPFKIIDARNMILVQHYETSKKDKKNFNWFFDNFKEYLKRPEAKGCKAVDVADLEKEDGGNLIQMLEHVYPQFKHIIVCFSDSYIKTVRGNNKKNFSFRKTIHDKTIMEFVNNGSRNKRCRCLVMPETTEPLETLWATVTYRFTFPEGFGDLVERLFDAKVAVKNMSSTGVHNSPEKAGASRNMVTQ